MKRDDDALQLDLTASITEVPQANNIELLIRVMEALRAENYTFSSLAEALEIDERTVRYYADFGRWLTWIRPAGDKTIALTAEGMAFAESVSARGRLFSTALFERPLVQTVNQVKRELFSDLDEPQATRQSCLHAVQRMTQLSESTARRRAGALASMLQWAYQPRQLDWATGIAVETTTAAFDFPGQSFLTAFSARQFSHSRNIYIGFPHQVVTFTNGQGASLNAKDWVRANYESGDGSARWFGSIPINSSTLTVARRGGPDLRRLLISCNPYISMITILMSSAVTASGAVSLTNDMYGLRLWHRDRELGPPLEALATIAATIDLIPIDTVPHLMGRHVSDDLRSGTDQDFIDVLLTSGIIHPVETSLALSRGVASELNRPAGDGPPLWERLSPIRDALHKALRRPLP